MAKRKPISNNLYRPEFFKVFLPHHYTSQKLVIPPDYIKNFSRTIRERIVLKDEEGNAWDVRVERNRNDVFINGWQNFVKHKCLSVGDFLVFQYDGRYSFLVKTFGVNGCKKDSSVAKAKIKVEEEQEDGDDESNGCKRARSKSRKKNSRGKCEFELPKDWNYLDKAEPIAPEWAFFVTVYCKECHYTVQIPSEIINREDVRLEKEMVLCNSEGKEWPVNVFYNKSDGRVYFRKGWTEFRNQNNLAFGDTCEFNFDILTFTNRIYVNIFQHVMNISE